MDNHNTSDLYQFRNSLTDMLRMQCCTVNTIYSSLRSQLGILDISISVL